MKQQSNYTNTDIFSESNPQLSVVVPAYNEEGNVPRLCADLKKVLCLLNISWEIIFVDDGSTDKTWEKIVLLQEQDRLVKGIRFSRNFGHQYALFAGLSNARGQAVIAMDADLQHPPEVIPQLLEQWYNGSKIVQAIRRDNENTSWSKKTSSRLFYKIFSLLSGVDLSAGMADFRLLDRQVVNELIKSKEDALFLRGLVEWLGFKTSKVEFVSGDRFSGNSKYSLKKMLKFAWTGIISFSIVPLRIGIFVGMLSSLFAFYLLSEAIYIKMFTDKAVPGWASTIGVVSLLFGLLFIFLGIVGEYIGRILIQVRGRQRFIISESTEFRAPSEKKMSVSTMSSNMAGKLPQNKNRSQLENEYDNQKNSKASSLT